MTDRPQDADLRARFEAQRRTEASETPSFAAMIARSRAAAAEAPVVTPVRVFRPRRLIYAGGLAAAVIAALLVVPRSHSEDEFEDAVRAFQENPALSAWQSPTDGLLNFPGSQLISTVPSVGVQQ